MSCGSCSTFRRSASRRSSRAARSPTCQRRASDHVGRAAGGRRGSGRQSPLRRHDPRDAAARAAGYRAALIPGAFVYGHATRLALRIWGENWLARGTAGVRFRRPVYNGDRLVVACGPVAAGPEGVEGALRVTRAEDGGVVLDGALGLATTAPTPPPELPLLPPFSPKLTVAPGGIEPGLRLGCHAAILTPEAVRQSLANFHETAPVYLERGVIHSGCLLRKTMSDAMGNLSLPMPMVFAGAEVRNLRPAEIGRSYATSARVTAVWESRGNHFFETEEWLIADGVDVVALHRRRNLYAMRPSS